MSFQKINKKLGFGCMRLKMTGEQVDYQEFNRMIDTFISAGFNYFDTAHGYIGGKSETSIRDCLAARYKREDFILANKLSSWCFKKEEDVVPLFESQLKLCGVDYFDFYLLHSITKNSYEKYKSCNCFEIVKKLKEQGKIKHIAMSFHDTADLLDTVLSEQDCIEAVQLQVNYLDYDDPSVQSRACYDVAVKHGKKVIVMEPVKGGFLANPPEKAAEIIKKITNGSYASYALRYAATLPNVIMVLSGMGNSEMMEDNIKTFTNFVPLTEEEFSLAEGLREIIRKERQIPCTKCNYCTEVCPKEIPIPDLFKVYNKVLSATISGKEAIDSFDNEKSGAAHCIKCGKCEKICPQGIKIKQYLEEISELR